MSRAALALLLFAAPVRASHHVSGVHVSEVWPDGLGPVSRLRRPAYVAALLDGLYGAVAAPPLFLFEAAQAVLLTPLMMLDGYCRGDRLFLFYPLRTAKNLLWDAVLVALGMASSLTAPLWNLWRPDERTGFMYAEHRLVFFGGPTGAFIKSGLIDAKAIAPSWHTVFVSRTRKKTRLREDRALFAHEFVHNRQIGRSFFWEYVGESYRDYSGWRDEDADAYLNYY